MEIQDEEFQALRLRVDKISSELDKQITVRAVNTKWMLTVGAVIVAALGYTNFYQVPHEAARAAKEKVGQEIMEKAKEILSDLQDTDIYAKEIKKELGTVSDIKKSANLPIGSIISSMLDSSRFAETVGDDTNSFKSTKNKWVLADGQKDLTGSKYHELTGKKHTPDLRGMFLRGMNVGRDDGKQDPKQERTVGDYQEDAILEHEHNTNALTFRWDDKTTNYGYTSAGTAHAPVASVTTVKDKKTAAEETRPRNVAVYFYIKIN